MLPKEKNPTNVKTAKNKDKTPIKDFGRFKSNLLKQKYYTV